MEFRRMFRFAALGVLAPLGGCAGMQTSTPAAVVITNTGSTNAIGYRVRVSPDGQASFETGDGPGQASLPPDLLSRIEHDVKAASPLSKLPASTSCMKSVSFGTTIFIAAGDERSPDLSCPADVVEQSLKDDVAGVVATLKIRNVPRGQGKELSPQDP
jgi:hypothetical protein